MYNRRKPTDGPFISHSGHKISCNHQLPISNLCQLRIAHRAIPVQKSYLVNAKFKIIMSLISAKGMDIHERYTVQEEKAPKLQINNSKIDRLHLLKVLIKVVLGDLGAVEAIDLALDIGIGPFVRYGTLAFTESSELTVTLLLGSTISQV